MEIDTSTAEVRRMADWLQEQSGIPLAAVDTLLALLDERDEAVAECAALRTRVEELTCYAESRSRMEKDAHERADAADVRVRELEAQVSALLADRAREAMKP